MSLLWAFHEFETLIVSLLGAIREIIPMSSPCSDTCELTSSWSPVSSPYFYIRNEINCKGFQDSLVASKTTHILQKRPNFCWVTPNIKLNPNFQATRVKGCKSCNGGCVWVRTFFHVWSLYQDFTLVWYEAIMKVAISNFIYEWRNTVKRQSNMTGNSLLLQFFFCCFLVREFICIQDRVCLRLTCLKSGFLFQL